MNVSTPIEQPSDARFAPEDAEALYRMGEWSDGFFGVGTNGHLLVRTGVAEAPRIDVAELVDDLAARGIRTPVLLRFHDVLRQRVRRINSAFADAVTETRFKGTYKCVYPIKVNQMREVVEEILDAGAEFGMGLECGSKAELVAALVQLEGADRLLLCNGVKDDDMLRLMLDVQQLGRTVLPVMEKLGELERMLALADELHVKVAFGVRVRLDASGAGKWASSAGSHSKFGLSIPELVDVARRLVREGRGDALRLLHFHIGSQIERIQSVKDAVRELTQIYVQLVRMGLTPGYLDVGGGLGVNYGGGYGDDEGSSIGYSLQEYANAVVFTVCDICDAAKVPHPGLVSESGRALTAHHSVLIIDVLGAYSKHEGDVAAEAAADLPLPLHKLSNTLTWLRELEGRRQRYRLLEVYHDAREAREEAGTLFDLGLLTLEQKASVERLYWAIGRELVTRMASLAEADVPPELWALEDEMAEHYLCNFSVFQSMVDHWAIGQRFPIVPITRLDERPDRRAVLVDLTCDSDGKVARYVNGHSARYLPLHALRGDEPYRLAVFMVGAYQDIMGDSHNLLGRVPEVHVYADAEEPCGYYVEKFVQGVTISSILEQVQYFPNDLERRMSDIVRAASANAKLTRKVGGELLERYRGMLRDGTYMEETRTRHERKDG
jgi:arginine decarboxylase